MILEAPWPLHQLTPDRACGDCSMCCKLVGVQISEDYITKPNEWCKHCAPKVAGCLIHDDRPECCRDFQCVWLGDKTWPEDLSPRKTNCVVVIQSISVAEGVDRTILRVHENKPHAVKNLDEMLYRSFCGGYCVVVYTAQDTVKSVVWDRKRRMQTVFETKTNGSNEVSMPFATWMTINKQYKGDVAALREDIEAIARENGVEPI